MTSISFNLSGKLDPSLVEVLRAVNHVATSLGIPFFVVGAMARAIVLESCYAIQPARRTLDLDIGVEVDGWEEFRRLTSELVATGKFVATREPHSLRANLYRVDIVPFGKISRDQKTISWPPEHEVVMTITGFAEASEYAMTLRLSNRPVLDVKVPMISSMALMKVISWQDCYPARPKDAEDLLFLMNHYAEAGNEERLYNEEVELLQAEGFDATLAGIRLLGRDMAAIASVAAGKDVASVLEAETTGPSRYRLVRDMIKGGRLNDPFNETLEKLKKLEQGYREGFHRKVSA
jgi:predicted nucleotidyltransferase